MSTTVLGYLADQIQHIAAAESSKMNLDDNALPHDEDEASAEAPQDPEVNHDEEDDDGYDDLEIVLENSTKAVEPAKYSVIYGHVLYNVQTWPHEYPNGVIVKGRRSRRAGSLKARR